MLEITNKISIPLGEIDFTAIRSPGPGGQNVNKVATAIHLRFNVKASSLAPVYKQRLLNLGDSRITKEGVVVIKAQHFRTQERNKEEALLRLRALIRSVTVTARKRKATKPTRGSQRKRIESKTKRGRIKALRGKIAE
jgi:ribosome-associated protein